MRTTCFVLICCLAAFLWTGCESMNGPVEEDGLSPLAKASDNLSGPKVTGEVEIVFMGGNGKNSPDDGRRAFAEFNAHEAYNGRPAKGEFYYRVYSADLLTLHREIIVEVQNASIVFDGKHSQFYGVVVYDSKGCAGNGEGGHGPECQGGACAGGHSSGDTGGGCSGDHTTDDGHDDGCSGDHTDDGTTHDDGGCSGSDAGGGSPGGDMGGSGGGCSGDHTTDDGTTDGGCSGDHTTDDGTTDGGCSGDHTDDGTTHDDGGCNGSDDHGGSTGGNGGAPATAGKYCRIGQYLYVKAKDASTPAVPDDRINWKWFAGKDEQLVLTVPWTHLCKKEIIGGNIVAH